MEREYTHIQIRVKTRERLKAIGKKGESYDAIINKLLDMYEGRFS